MFIHHAGFIGISGYAASQFMISTCMWVLMKPTELANGVLGRERGLQIFGEVFYLSHACGQEELYTTRAVKK